MEDIENPREKRNHKVNNIEHLTMTEIRERGNQTRKKRNLSKRVFREKRAKQQKNEGHFL